ncbi:hypothetical protein AAZX31_14G184700 [Glycine max]
MNGKPDVYSLISCVSFAIMSFSLSRQTQCGFEVDLFYFFLGCLIVLLLKIKFALAVVGVGFSYSLIILRSSLDTALHHNLGAQVDQLASTTDTSAVVLFVDQLGRTDIDVAAVQDIVVEGQRDNAQRDNASMMQQLMACIEVLRQGNSNLTNMLLEHTKEYFDDKSELAGVDHNFVIDALPSGKINDLEETIKLMVDDGLEKECCDVYCNWRRESLEQCIINLLRLQGINIEEKLEQREFQYYILRWIKAVNVAHRILFPSERRLCDCIFSRFSSVADLCFNEVCRGALIQLLNFAEAVASGSPSEWRLSKILDMFETLRDLIPEFQSLFPESMVKEVMKVHDKLGEASRVIFMNMENVIFHIPETKVIAPADGRVHLMTKHVIRYLVFTSRAQKILEQILEQYPKFANEVAKSNSVSDQIDQVIKRLETELVTVSKNYDKPALRYFFLMNNWRCVELEAIKLRLNLGCFHKDTTKVQQNLELYQSSSWNMVLNFLKLENNELVEPNANAESLKGSLNLFNMHFKDICSTQSRWLAFDKQLSEKIIMSLQHILLPAYGNFIEKLQDVLGIHASEYIKYGLFDIKDQLNHLFLGSMPMNQYLKDKEKLLKLA